MQTVIVPCFNDFTGIAQIPANTVITGPTTAFIQVTNNPTAFGVPTDPNAGTRLLTTALSVSANITLGNPSIPTTVTSPSMINAPHVYEAELYVFNGFSLNPEPQDYQLNLTPVGNTISFNVTNPAGTFFPSVAVAYVIIYENH